MIKKNIKVNEKSYIAIRYVARNNDMYMGEILDILVEDFIKQNFDKSVEDFIESSKDNNMTIKKRENEQNG